MNTQPETPPVVYRPLPAQFTKNGFAFHLIKRHEDVVLYRKDKPLPGGHLVSSYEICHVQNNDAYVIVGNHVEAKESLPCSEKWGTHGWTEITYQRARVIFDRECAKLAKGNGK